MNKETTRNWYEKLHTYLLWGKSFLWSLQDKSFSSSRPLFFFFSGSYDLFILWLSGLCTVCVVLSIVPFSDHKQYLERYRFSAFMIICVPPRIKASHSSIVFLVLNIKKRTTKKNGLYKEHSIRQSSDAIVLMDKMQLTPHFNRAVSTWCECFLRKCGLQSIIFISKLLFRKITQRRPQNQTRKACCMFVCSAKEQVEKC